MALSIDYLTNIISVPKADTQFVGINPQTGLEVRQLNIVTFAQNLADYQDEAEGIWAPTAYSYTQPADVGGVQLAPVLLILSPYTVTFENGAYAVNFVGANTNLQDFTNVNQVSIRPNNSAGLTFSDEVNKQSFQGGAVWIDTLDGLSGTQFSRGTTSNPVNNFVDADAIAMANNLHDFRMQGTAVLPNGLSLARYTIFGDNPASAIFIFDNNNVENAGFERLNAVGSITGRAGFKECSLGKTLGLTGVQGILDNCSIAGDLTLDASATEPIIFKDCISAIAGIAKPGLNCNGTAAGINFRRYAGGLAITNFNNVSGTMTLDLMGGEVSLNSANCTDGVVVTRGVGKLIDENGADIPTGTWNGITIVNKLTNGDVGGSLTVDQSTQLAELHKLRGLKVGSPATMSPTRILVEDVDLDIATIGTTSTVTRQP
jgi:hypothetical protein